MKSLLYKPTFLPRIIKKAGIASPSPMIPTILEIASLQTNPSHDPKRNKMIAIGTRPSV
jgi:hypothetical protein